MTAEKKYDCAITGGGLGGLTLAINLAQRGFSVILFEKEHYPFHKVCGEYISIESWDYLTSLTLPLQDMNLPIIKELIVSAPNGNTLQQTLPLGGFGISRFTLDNQLKEIAVQSGVTVMEGVKVEDINFQNDEFLIHTTSGDFSSRVCAGCFGKRSNIDVKWKRNFIRQPASKLNNFIAVKYHIETDFPADTIVLHNFKDGYCGMSKVDGNKYCLCYLTNAANLKACDNSIEKMEATILSKNPHLKNIFSHSKRLYATPLSISQISFDHKDPVENNVLMIGDAAGSITPLCGNGMSMAMHAGKIAAENISLYLKGTISRDEMELSYAKQWKKTFGARIKTGRIIQRFFGKPWLTNVFIRFIKTFPGLTRIIIRKTHGKKF